MKNPSANSIGWSKINCLLAHEPDPSFARRAKIILGNLGVTGQQQLLDVGCGRGFYLKTLASFWPKLKLSGIDLNEKYLSIAKETLGDRPVQLIKASATALPFPDNYFNRVLASEVLEHVKDDQKAIGEIHRVLKPGGIAMISVPNKNYPLLLDPLNWFLEKLIGWHIPSRIWWLAGIWADHERLYGVGQISKKIKNGGFKIEKIWLSTHYCFPFLHFLLYGIGKNLVEKGFCQSFNRFSDQPKLSLLNKILLWPIRAIDKINDMTAPSPEASSVNLIFKVKK